MSLRVLQRNQGKQTTSDVMARFFCTYLEVRLIAMRTWNLIPWRQPSFGREIKPGTSGMRWRIEPRTPERYIFLFNLFKDVSTEQFCTLLISCHQQYHAWKMDNWEGGGAGDLRDHIRELSWSGWRKKHDKIQGGRSPADESGTFRTRSSNVRQSVTMKRSRHRFHCETH